MRTYSKRAMITLRPEWESELNLLKKEQFYNQTQAEMYRYLIQKGLDSLKTEQTKSSSESIPL